VLVGPELEAVFDFVGNRYRPSTLGGVHWSDVTLRGRFELELVLTEQPAPFSGCRTCSISAGAGAANNSAETCPMITHVVRHVLLASGKRGFAGNYGGESGFRWNEVRYCCFLTAGAFAARGHLYDMAFILQDEFVNTAPLILIADRVAEPGDRCNNPCEV
jgi:hypothetical protein